MRLQQLKNFLFLALLLLVPSIVFAAPLLDPINDSFKNTILGSNPGWQTIITATAKSLFWKLVMLDMTWTFIVYVKDRKEIGEIISSYVGKIFTIGFFWLLLMSASTWIPALIGLFSETGQAVATANKAQVDSLDGVFTQGLALAGVIMGALDGLDTLQQIAMGIPASIGAFCAALGFAFIAGQLLVTLIESYIGIAAGMIMLGFGGSRWTSEMATNYLKFAMGTGMKLMLCYLIIGLGFNLFSNIIPPNGLNDSTEFLAYVFRVSALVLIYVYLVFNIPGLASAIMSGSPNMSLGGGDGGGDYGGRGGCFWWRCGGSRGG